MFTQFMAQAEWWYKDYQRHAPKYISALSDIMAIYNHSIQAMLYQLDENPLTYTDARLCSYRLTSSMLDETSSADAQSFKGFEPVTPEATKWQWSM